MPNDDALLQKRFLELAEKAYARGTYTFTNFLGLAEQDLFALVRRELVHVPHSLFGGCDGCDGCSGCGSGCPTGCSGCGSGCPTGCSSSCTGGCKGGCGGSCGSGCPNTCTENCAYNK